MASPQFPKCPACGTSDSVLSHGKRHSFYPFGCLLIAGPFLALFHQATSPIDYECRACGRKFSRRTALTWFCVALTLIAILLYLAKTLLAIAAL